MFKIRQLIPIAGLFVLASGSLFADVVPTDGSWTEFLFGTAGSFAGACSGGCDATVNPVAAQGPDSPWTFSGAATLDVTDLFIAGDQFDVFDNGVDIGDTSIPTNTGVSTCTNDISCALADPTDYSQEVYDLGDGDHSITIEVIQNAAGQTGGAAAFSVTTATPEPGTLALLGAGFGALYLRRRRKA